MSSSIPRIRLYLGEEASPAVRDGLELCFYMPHPHEALKSGVRRALGVYLHAVGENALGSYLDRDGEWQPLDARGWELTRRDLHDGVEARIHLTEEARGDERFDFHYLGKALGHPEAFRGPDDVSALAVSLPTEFLETQGPGRVRSLALDMAWALPFSSGHAGLSFLGEPLASSVRDEVERLALRHPAIDVPYLDGRARTLGTRVLGPSWMTFLGPPVLTELGGAEALRARLRSPGTLVQDLGSDRAIVTLGPAPQAGDTEQGQTLPAYRELARVLEPWLFQTPPGPSAEQSPFIHDRRSWQRRFLD
ncbi:DUF3396 domain-containing protein [Corallococcus terminator]|nr:DUF3396 domain-containing protein [Corallococcus terminator]